MTQPCCLRNLRLQSVGSLFVLLFAFASSAVAQTTTPVDLFEKLDPVTATVSGTWSLADGEITVAPEKAARLLVRSGMPLDYDISLEFTRVEGEDSVCVILPVGEISPALELSAWQGEAHGLSRVNGGSARDDANPASVKPGTLENGIRYRLDVSVKASAQPASVTATLDSKPLLSWSGPIANLQPNFAMNLPTTRTLGIAAQENLVTFHSLKMLAETSPTPPPPSPGKTDPDAIDLSGLGQPGTPGWETFNEAVFTTASENGVPIASGQVNSGNGDRGAYLDGVTFSEGTIEVELRGSGQPQSSFIGVVFHGEDGDTYDSVYFRPFNFGNPDSVRRGHAVQYMSHPDWPWRKLRTERPEEFENPASPEPNPTDWFQARVEVKDGRIRTFIDGSADPCLDVEKLSETNSGKVGLWFNGVASFRNLKIEAE